jgi:hypothetical protein
LEKIFQEVDQEMSEQKKDEKEIPVDYLKENEKKMKVKNRKWKV